MPDDTQSTELRQLRTHFNKSRREIQTIGLRQGRLDISDKLDLVFVMDTTATMGDDLEDVADSLAGIASAIASQFPSVKYAVISFKDEGNTVIETGASFVNLATAQAALDGLTASGGGDTPDNGFGALWLAAKMPWRDEAARAVILISNTSSHERGKTFENAKNTLLNNGCNVFVGLGLDDDFYDSIVTATGGEKIQAGTVEQTTNRISNALKGIANPVQDPIYLVNDSEPFEAFLETGAEVTFVNRSFALNPFTSGEDGALSISLTIDNTDFAVSRYLAKARKFPIALEVVLRIYFSDDASGPQNNPPIALFATDFETRGAVVSCQVRFLDLQNASFPNAFYTTQRCPSLQ